MSKGAVVLSAVPDMVGGTLGQIIEHYRDKNLIVAQGGITSIISALTAHTHGVPNITGNISITSNQTDWSISIPDFLTTAAQSDHTHSDLYFNISNSTLFATSYLSNTFLTTAANSTHTHSQYAGTGFTGTNATGTLNSNGLALSIGTAGGADGFNRIGAGTQTAGTNTTVIFSNSNDISFGMSGGSRITASFSQSTHAHPYLSSVSSTNFVPAGSALGTATAQSNVTWTANTAGLSIDARGYAGTTTAATGAGLTVNSQGIRVSFDTAGISAAADGVNFLAAGSQTATTAGTIKFENSNGITFGMSDQTQITAQHNAFSTSAQLTATFMQTAEPHIRQIVASDSSYNTGTVHFVGANNITVSYNGSSISIIGDDTHPVQTGISALIVSDATFNSGTVSFKNANNVTFGSSGANIITASIQPPINFSASNALTTANTLLFGEGSGVTFHVSNGSIAASVETNYLASQSNQAVSGSNGSFAWQTLGVLGSGAADVYTTAGDSLVVSVPAQSQMPGVISFNATSGALSLSVGTNLTLSPLNGSTYSLYGPANILNSLSVGGNTGTTGSSNITGGGFVIAGGSNITLSQSNNTISIHGSGGIQIGASDTTYQTGTVVIRGEANVTVHSTEVLGVQYVDISAAVGTAAGDGYNRLIAGSQTATSAGYVSLANSNGISFGMSDNSIITASHNGLTVQSQAPMWFSASGTATSSNTIQFADSQGVSWSLNNASVVATVRTDYPQAYELEGTQTAGTTSLTMGSQQYFSGHGNITLSGNSNTLVISGGGGAVSGSNGSFTYNTLTLGASNGLTFYTTGSQIVGSMASGSLHFQDGGGVVWGGATAGFNTTITASVTGGGTATGGIAIADSVSTKDTGTVRFINSNGLSFSLSGSNMVGSYLNGFGYSSSSITGSLLDAINDSNGFYAAVPRWITTAMASNANTSFVGLNTAQTRVTWTVNSSGISLNAAGYAGTGFTSATRTGSVIAGTNNTAGLYLSIPNYLTTAMQSACTSNLAAVGFSTGSTAGSLMTGTLSTNGLYLRVPNYLTTTPTGSVVFVDSLGTYITWGSSVGTGTASVISYIYATGGGGTGGGGGAAIQGSGTSIQSTGTVRFSNSNGISFGLTSGTMTASILRASLALSDSNGISFGLYSSNSTGSTVTASHNAYYTSSQLTNTFLQLASSTRFYSATSQFSASFLNTGEAHIRALGFSNTGTYSSNAFTSGSVMLSGINLTVSSSANGASQYLNISAPAIGYLFFSNTNGHSWSSSVNGMSTSVYIIT